MASIVAGAAGTVLGGMYLDGKLGLARDIREIRKARALRRLYAEAALYYLFEHSVLTKPNEECIWSREGCFTWKETSDRVHQYAQLHYRCQPQIPSLFLFSADSQQWFLSKGVKTRDYVNFYMSNSPEFLFAWLGLWAIGAAPAMINYHLTGKALIHCLRVSGAKLMLVDDEPGFRERIESERLVLEGELGLEICVMDGGMVSDIHGSKAQRPQDSYRDAIKGEWPMAMFYTSGTTGFPKGVPFKVDRGFYLGAVKSAGFRRTIDGDRWYDCMPFYHATGGVQAVTMLMSGITLCVGKKFSTSKFWSEVHDSRATWITYVGETARYLLAAPPSPLDKDHNVRAMYGNGLRPDVWFKFRERFAVPEVLEFFSSSEGVFGLVNHSRGDYLATAVGTHGAIFRYLTRNTIVPVLVDQASGDIVRDPQTGFAHREPYEKGGEIIVQLTDPKDFAGYYNNPGATQKKFERDVFKKGDIWFRTGDALRRTSDGRWFFLDRLGDTFRWKGENVSTAEVAEVLGSYPGVVEANVYGVSLPSHDGRAGCAAIYIDPNFVKGFDFAGLLKHSRTHLPKYAVPVFIRVVKEMTPIHNNKQNKVPLREEGVDPDKVKADDKVFWIDGLGRGNSYVEFKKDHWEDLQLGKAQL
ncbi:related to very long-chain fatty acyl-CoA synthetase FAT1 [Rhynchosporium graminicola]|uniref:Very long-chain fatty acid transport protein n=1 Tax=Rhynchosporium graminicola TaxID=2792576 RepID=A0A1E1LTV4_9HELO|nr:related to very long-chain fatty acyl-CoA synthetase FAT1 [Rhynchosporium commune]